MAAELGAEYEIIEEGLSGRTTNADDPTDARLNGANYLPSALASHLPLDLVIVMLGTNDAKVYFNRTVFDITIGMSVLIGQVATSRGGIGTTYPAPTVLLVAPPPLSEIPSPWFADLYEGGRDKTIELAPRYATLAAFLGVSFVDAGTVVSTDGIDGIHFTSKNNTALGVRLAEEVRAVLGSAR
jgi:lysophospholipase L1-like esterase